MSEAGDLADFLRCVQTPCLYLVGDIVDCWQLRRSWHWPETHDELLGVLIGMARRGTSITYLPGNHDSCLRRLSGLDLGWLLVRDTAVHKTLDGRRLLVCHGDEFDAMNRNRVVSAFISRLGDLAISLDRLLGVGIGRRVVNATHEMVARAGDFEEAMKREARTRCLDGVVCGHSHLPRRVYDRGFLYANAGDWVGSRTALTEDHLGRIRLVRWPAVAARASELRSGPLSGLGGEGVLSAPA